MTDSTPNAQERNSFTGPAPDTGRNVAVVGLGDFVRALSPGIKPYPGLLKGLRGIYNYRLFKQRQAHDERRGEFDLDAARRPAMWCALVRGFEQAVNGEVDAIDVVRKLLPLWTFSPDSFADLLVEAIEHVLVREARAHCNAPRVGGE